MACHIQDLCQLDTLTEESILECVQRRFSENFFFTYIGDVLISVNPCKLLPIYEKKYHDLYKGLSYRGQQDPHIFWTADYAFQSLVQSRVPRCIIVSGISGAGKTESTKYILQHILQEGHQNAQPIINTLTRVNPLLELFGNAKTSLNHNSSRFGKLIRLHYDTSTLLTGADIQCYTLEKSRVIYQHPRERNFHIFYAMLSGMTSEELEPYSLHKNGSYRILNHKRCVSSNGTIFEDNEENAYRVQFQEAKKALYKIGINNEGLEDMFRVLAAILLLTNIKFLEDDSGYPVIDDDDEELLLQPVCSLLGIEPEDLVEALLQTIRQAGKGERFKASKTVAMAEDGRDALAKHLYNCLFEGVVCRINQSLKPLQRSPSASVALGILDISGFESLVEGNSFEQLCINITNETLHQLFLKHVFERELQAYVDEGVENVDVQYTDNQLVLDLLVKSPYGILPLLEESNRINDSDTGFVDKLNQFCVKCNKYRQVRRQRHPMFTVEHFAGEVTYDAAGFLEKNMDTLSDTLKQSLRASSNTFLKVPHEHDTISRATARSLQNKRAAGERNKLQDFVSANYMKSLKHLTGKLNQMKPLFVRCIKPNDALEQGRFDRSFVSKQLLSAGAMELASVRKMGYPVRMTYEVFIDRYSELMETLRSSNIPAKEKSIMVLRQNGINEISGFVTGTKKVFLKDKDAEKLNQQLHEKRLKKLTEKKETIERERRETLERERKEREANHMKLGEDIHTPNDSSNVNDSPVSSLSPGKKTWPSFAEEDQLAVQLEGAENGSEMGDENDGESLYEQKEGKTEKAYDMFKENERENDDEADIWEKRFLRASRFFLYILIISVVIASGVFVKLCLFELISLYSKTNGNERLDKANKLMLCVIIPLALTLLTSLLKITFGRVNPPKLKYLISVSFLEGLQTVGMALLLFRVLPAIDTFRGSILLMNVTLVPSILSCFEKLSSPSGKWIERTFKLVTAFLVLTIQVGSTVYLCIAEFETMPQRWFIPISLGLISLGWWENFMHGQLNGFSFNLFSIRLSKTRNKTNVWVSLVKIATMLVCTVVLVDDHSFVFSGRTTISQNNKTKPILTTNETYFAIYANMTDSVNSTEGENIVLSYEDNVINCTKKSDISSNRGQRTIVICNKTTYTALFDCVMQNESMRLLCNLTNNKTHNFEHGNTFFDQVYVFWDDNFFIINIGLCSLVFHYFSTLACKLHMQKFAFCLPLVLISPLTTCIVYVKCRKLIDVSDIFGKELICVDFSFEKIKMTVIVGSLLWISLLLITYYIWIPKYERMAKLERIFTLPAKDFIVSDFNLLLRRKNDIYREKPNERTNDEVDNGRRFSIPHFEEEETPKVFICATMWHETREEMMQLLKSLLRIDFSCAARAYLSSKYKKLDPDKYDPEIHIIFDDAFEDDQKTMQRVPNNYVLQFTECVTDAARIVVHEDVPWNSAPEMMTLPYGGRLVWTLPGSTKLIVHLKDKSKIRHRKRWSQIMYMYYLLGYKSFGYETEDDVLKASGKKITTSRPHRNASILQRLKPELRLKMDNTFILALDGDVDFQPNAVRLLIDKMKKNKKVGAVCGRIHPIGSGPMVWYQKFEYAVGHWLQKAAEHILGCVLCCPGCFSLFRASALMDNNVLRTYTTPPTAAKHHIQFEQGEDRWLCTLLLQQGYKIDYCAGSDALTFAPESFNEFFVQRRRWSPSTMANIMDLLSSWGSTVRRNDNISTPYMIYQSVMLLTSLLAPATVAILIAGSYSAVLGLDPTISYYISLIPIAVYLFICLKCKNDVQLKSAALLSSVYSIVMVIVTIGTILNILQDSFFSPNVLFLCGVGVMFVLTGLLHPKEFGCLGYGILYYITVPSTFIFLTVYFVTNLNNVSWGTREKKTVSQTDTNTNFQKHTLSPLEQFLHMISKFTCFSFLKNILTNANEDKGKENESNKNGDGTVISENSDSVEMPKAEKKQQVVRTQILQDDRYWMQYKCFKKAKPCETTSEDEDDFWHDILKKYLHPIPPNRKHEIEVKEELDALRDNVVFGFFLLNLLFSVSLFQLQLNREQLLGFYILGRYEPVSILFMASFTILLLLQFIAMVIHRWGTFQHLIASTSVRGNKDEEFDVALHYVNQLVNPEPNDSPPSSNTSAVEEIEPDYDSDFDEENPPPAKSRYPERYYTRNAYQGVFKKNFPTMRRHIHHSVAGHHRHRLRRQVSKSHYNDPSHRM